MLSVLFGRLEAQAYGVLIKPKDPATSLGMKAAAESWQKDPRVDRVIETDKGTDLLKSLSDLKAKGVKIDFLPVRPFPTRVAAPFGALHLGVWLKAAQK
jgi:hypothetical protein